MQSKEQEILRLLNKGNKSGLKDLFDLMYKPLCIFAYKYINSHDVCEDIVQDIFIKFWENQSYKNITIKLSSYLYKSVRNSCLNYIRDTKQNEEWLEEYDDKFSNEEVELVNNEEI